MRFNPPPNWPPAPPGWVPDSSWVPDPAWPPPPPGWQLWVDDSAPQYPPQFTPGYPPQFPTQQYSSQWQPPKPPGSTAVKSLWIALAAVAVVALVAVVAIFTFGGGGGATKIGGSGASGKSDITQLTKDLLVGRSAFPEFGGAQLNSGLLGPGRKQPGPFGVSVSPQECAEFYNGQSTSATESAGGTISESKPAGFIVNR